MAEMSKGQYLRAARPSQKLGWTRLMMRGKGARPRVPARSQKSSLIGPESGHFDKNEMIIPRMDMRMTWRRVMQPTILILYSGRCFLEVEAIEKLLLLLERPTMTIRQERKSPN